MSNLRVTNGSFVGTQFVRCNFNQASFNDVHFHTPDTPQTKPFFWSRVGTVMLAGQMVNTGRLSALYDRNGHDAPSASLSFQQCQGKDFVFKASEFIQNVPQPLQPLFGDRFFLELSGCDFHDGTWEIPPTCIVATKSKKSGLQLVDQNTLFNIKSFDVRMEDPVELGRYMKRRELQWKDEKGMSYGQMFKRSIGTCLSAVKGIIIDTLPDEMEGTELGDMLAEDADAAVANQLEDKNEQVVEVGGVEEVLAKSQESSAPLIDDAASTAAPGVSSGSVAAASTNTIGAASQSLEKLGKQGARFARNHEVSVVDFLRGMHAGTNAVGVTYMPLAQQDPSGFAESGLTKSVAVALLRDARDVLLEAFSHIEHDPRVFELMRKLVSQDLLEELLKNCCSAEVREAFRKNHQAPQEQPQRYTDFRFARDVCRLAELELDEFNASLRKLVLTKHLNAKTSYSVKHLSYWKLLTKIIFAFPPQQLVEHLKELQFVRNRMEKLDDPILDGTWQDITESWVSLMQFLLTVRGERARQVLEVIFTDMDLIQGLQYCRLFLVLNPKNAPQDLVSETKQLVGGHIKRFYELYVRALDAEIANIERIQALKAQLVAFIGSIILSVFVGLSNFASRCAYEHYYS
eukprot:TRINITY_DN40957_c0_g1_i1.p1 TRINITY_DN40957_c0_g1~~TRINITY_DN40957_c0_g1_i1.p1  ORF type:complete len:684 (-),score=113.74 TRINITY_DN40957_c0_g1_i1:85-1977(-)